MQQRLVQWEMEATADEALLDLWDLQTGIRSSLSMGAKVCFIMREQCFHVSFPRSGTV
jgi:hypothetical protein